MHAHPYNLPNNTTQSNNKSGRYNLIYWRWNMGFPNIPKNGGPGWLVVGIGIAIVVCGLIAALSKIN
jgi:hypothetical protein